MITYTLEEICIQFSLPRETVVTFIEREWISPLENNSERFDEEDQRRMHFILELKNDFAVNNEGVDIILHLLDQLHSLRRLQGLKNEISTQ